MAFIKLHIPTLVRDAHLDDKPIYYLRPLFVEHPVATHRRFEAAVARFQKEVKHFFKGYVLERNNADQLLWYLFSPEVRYHQFHFQFNLGSQFIDGVFGVIAFELSGHFFIGIPALHNFIFLATQKRNEKVDVEAQAKKAAKELLRQIKADEGSDFEPSLYYSGKREFVTTIEVSVNIGSGPFKFEQVHQHWFFTRLMQESIFDGSVEIEKVGYDLNSRYPADLRRAYHQDELVDKLYRILFQEERTSIALVGPEGVGKHTILHEVIWRYQRNHYGTRKGRPEHIWHLDPTRVIAGMSIVGMWQKRFEAILKYLRQPVADHPQSSDKLLIDNPVALLRIGKSAQSNMTLSDVLKPYLEKRQLQLTLIATPEQWQIVQEKNRGFSDLFQVIRLSEPDLETAARIILRQRTRAELENDARITIQAVNQLLTIQRNYLKHRALPGSVLKLLEQLAVKYKGRTVDAQEVRDEFKAFSGLEERIFDHSQQLDKGQVRKVIAQQLVGQSQAVDNLVNAIHLVKAKLADKSKPISSFLFIGPTGVGKTQAAKVLCQYLMGSEDHLMRFDMNEYIDGYAVQRLIGDYYNPEGQLTGKVRYRPFGVLLLDEIEKAHPAVHDLLLQVLDDGRLTDSLGRTVDFSNIIIIMTSNLGAREAGAQLGFDRDTRDDSPLYRKAVENFFRPEFINRIDSMVIFNPLELDHILGIARLQIRELLQRDGFVRRATILNIDQEALAWVAQRGFNPRMGGRALKRQIERDLTTLSADQLVSTHSDNPIIFDILYQDGRLVPRISPLDFVSPIEEDWLPQLPEEAGGKRFYAGLLREIEKLEKEISRYEQGKERPEPQVIIIGDEADSQELNWQYFDFKNKVAEVKDGVQTMMLGFRERFFRQAPAIPIRLRRSSLIPRRDIGSRGIRENMRDRLFQEEGLRELSEAYQFATNQFDSLKTEFINYYLDVALLKLQARSFFRGESESITLHFQSLITGLGGAEIQFLMDRYADLFKQLDLTFHTDFRKRQIQLEGHGLSQLLHGEGGIHLFYVAHQNPLPVEIRLLKNDAKRPQERFLRVVRIYDGTQALTDLRTGYSNAVNITGSEFKLLLYAGVPPEIRRQLMSERFLER